MRQKNRIQQIWLKPEEWRDFIISGEAGSSEHKA